MCDIFTRDELLARSYANDVGLYYSRGPGHGMSRVLGAPYVNAMTRMMKQGPMKLSMSFAHDTDLFFIVSLLGVFDGESDLSLTHQDLNALWKTSNISPMGTHLVMERLQCHGDNVYVRIVHNDAVLPVVGLSSGPGFSTPLAEFERHIAERLNGTTYVASCGVKGLPEELTFFWD